MTKSVWETLSKIDVGENTEQKGNLTYLSWAWAWGTLKDHYPDATFEKHWFEMGEPSYKIPYAMDKQGYAYVMVSVKVLDHTICETFPVLDHRNNSVKTPNSFQINSSLQRCLAKAIAYHGLGHYIYAGEDLPPAISKPKKNEKTEYSRTSAKLDGRALHDRLGIVETPTELESVIDEYEPCMKFLEDDLPDWHADLTEHIETAKKRVAA